MKGFFFSSALVVLFALYALPVSAATFTVSNQAEFVNAVRDAIENGEDDIIIMAAGNYYGSTCLMKENHSLTIQGAGAGKTIIMPADYNSYGFEYKTLDSMDDSSAHFSVSGVTFREAKNIYSGLAVSVNRANITIENSEFTNNASSMYGAGLNVSCDDVSTVIVRNNTFSNNTQTTTAQGAGANIASYGPITIESNTFTGNSSQSGGGGLAAFADGSYAISVSGNTFVSNSVMNGASREGIGGGASVLSSQTGAIVMVNNIFYGNLAEQGGGAQLQTLGSGAVTVVNNTFYENSADRFGGLTVIPASGASNIYNNILYGNLATAYPQNIGIVNVQPSVINMYNNNMESYLVAGSTTNLSQAGNINSDPLLNSLWHLIKGSPCIDKGLATAPSIPSVDIDGNPRVVNGSVDIGAAEYTGAEVRLVRGSSTYGFYATVNEALNHVVDGDSIQIPATELTEDLVFASPASVSLTGGYNYKYAENPGMTIINGSITIKSGGTVGVGWFTLR